MIDAERRARERVRRILEGARRSFSKEGNQAYYRKQLSGQSPELWILTAREGDKYALELLREYGRGARRHGHKIPDELHTFVWELFLDGPPKLPPGPKPWDTVIRDPIIQNLVKVVSEEFGFSPTRNPATKTISACALVADEISKLGLAALDEAGVEGIWNDRQK
jgi:hypothetical protein